MTSQPVLATAHAALDRVIAPLRLDDLQRASSEVGHLAIARQSASYFDDVLLPDDVEQVVSAALALTGAGASAPVVELLRRQGKERVSSGEAARAGFARGATIRVSQVDKTWPSIARLARGLSRELRAPISVNLYVTPPDSQGLRCHYDRHDVLVLQIAGSKNWRIRSQAKDSPLEHLPILSFETPQWMSEDRLGQDQFDRDITDECWDLNLERGDTLYIAQGRRHEASAGGEMSVHLTFGIHALRFVEVASQAIGRAAARDGRWRQVAIHPSQDTPTREGRLRELLLELANDGAALTHAFAALDEAQEETRGVADFTFSGGDDTARSLTVDSIIRRSGKASFAIEEGGERVNVTAGDVQITVPAAATEAIVFIGENRVFRAGDISTRLDARSKLILLAKLIDAGLLRTTGSTAT